MTRLPAATLTAVLLFGSLSTSHADPFDTMDIGLNLGLMNPVDKESYINVGADFHVELLVSADRDYMRYSFLLGYIDRTRDSYRGYAREYQQAFLSAEFSFDLLPLRLTEQKTIAQPIVGIGIGGILAAGDNEDSYPMITPRLGVEFDLTKGHFLGIDLAYHLVFGEGDELPDGDNLDYITALLGYRYRFPLDDDG